LQLDLETAGEYKRFSAELRSDAGDLVWGPEMLRPQNTRWGRTLPLTLPADVVSDGEYEIILRGVVEKSEFEDSGHYYFAAVRR
jgi:hypothetical protein